MAVRIVSDPLLSDKVRFVLNYKAYKDLIDRCFYYLLNRFPNPEGEQDAYGTLVQRLYELDVFGKFDPKRLVAQKKGISKKNLHKVSDAASTDESLKNLGINVDKKFEQFMFKWIEHVLQEAYVRRSKQAARYIPWQEMAHMPPRNSSELWDRLHECRFAQGEEEIELLDQHLKKKARIDYVKTYPTYSNIGDFVGGEIGDALEELSASDLKNKIRAQLHNSERRVFDLAVEGLAGSDIAKAMKCSPQNVNCLMVRIREKFRRYINEQLAVA